MKKALADLVKKLLLIVPALGACGDPTGPESGAVTFRGVVTIDGQPELAAVYLHYRPDPRFLVWRELSQSSTGPDGSYEVAGTIECEEGAPYVEIRFLTETGVDSAGNPIYSLSPLNDTFPEQTRRSGTGSCGDHVVDFHLMRP